MLTKQQIDSYHMKGYIGVEGVLNAQEVETLRQTTEEFVENLGEEITCGVRDTTVSDFALSHFRPPFENAFQFDNGSH